MEMIICLIRPRTDDFLIKVVNTIYADDCGRIINLHNLLIPWDYEERIVSLQELRIEDIQHETRGDDMRWAILFMEYMICL